MKRLRWLFCGLLLTGLPALAQVPGLAGDGLKGDYYDGRDFNTFVLSQRDAVINFDWHHENPVPGLPAENFSVRWTGWLVPPTTGRYVLHMAVDDGVRPPLARRPPAAQRVARPVAELLRYSAGPQGRASLRAPPRLLPVRLEHPRPASLAAPRRCARGLVAQPVGASQRRQPARSRSHALPIQPQPRIG
jgi:hypothetical protein